MKYTSINLICSMSHFLISLSNSLLYTFAYDIFKPDPRMPSLINQTCAVQVIHRTNPYPISIAPSQTSCQSKTFYSDLEIKINITNSYSTTVSSANRSSEARRLPLSEDFLLHQWQPGGHEELRQNHLCLHAQLYRDP